MSQREVKK